MTKEEQGKRKKRVHQFSPVPELGYYLVITGTEEIKKNYLLGLEERLKQYCKTGITTPSAICPCTTLHRHITDIKSKKIEWNP